MGDPFTAAEQMAEQPVPAVEPARVGPQKPFHPRNQIGLGRLHHQVEVIVHQTKRMHVPVGFNATLTQRFQETLPILVILENRFPLVTAIHDMINRTRIFQSNLARHRPNNYLHPPLLSTVWTDPFTFRPVHVHVHVHRQHAGHRRCFCFFVCQVINPQFDEAGSFSDGLAQVKAGGRFGYIDATGKYVWNPSK